MARLIGSTMPRSVIGEQVRLAPQDPQAQTALGLIYARPRKMTKPARLLKKLPSSRQITCGQSINSLSSTYWISISTLLERRYTANSKRHLIRRPPIFLKARSSIAEQKWDLAAAELKKRCTRSRFSGAYDLLVQTYVATNKLPQALDQLQAQLSKDPNDASALMMLALLYERIEISHRLATRMKGSSDQS